MSKKHIAISKEAWLKIKAESAVKEKPISDVVDDLIKKIEKQDDEKQETETEK